MSRISSHAGCCPVALLIYDNSTDVLRLCLRFPPRILYRRPHLPFRLGNGNAVRFCFFCLQFRLPPRMAHVCHCSLHAPFPLSHSPLPVYGAVMDRETSPRRHGNVHGKPDSPMWAFPYRAATDAFLCPSGMSSLPWIHASKNLIFTFCPVFVKNTQPSQKCKFSCKSPFQTAKTLFFALNNTLFSPSHIGTVSIYTFQT